MTLHDLLTGACPDCGGTKFLFGPRGGASRNVECTGCTSRFNVTVHRGKVLYGQRIARTSNWSALGHIRIGELKDAEDAEKEMAEWNADAFEDNLKRST